ncbi:hypothetical protein [Caenimonas koreensis]|uniref:Uncharacterized protein n=1 Tax=Caenimonas koreensis DSM 17982 TaxID=1121255 RepID=A0A844B9N0_9BURK|nr:hypothetical protein [Caenimonas koreensis]MRD48216.1 hypothetical protein [Caenimonas koreensis DSM 17982]
MATDKKKFDPAPLTDTGALYSARDFRAQTNAVEKDTDSAWDMWVEANKSIEQKPPGDQGYARTGPVSLTSDHASTMSTVPAKLGEDPGSESEARMRRRNRVATVDDAMLEARRNNRVCPRPNHWQTLYEMLPNRTKSKPTPPLIGPLWNSTPSITKRTCLREHFEWADQHGVLAQVMNFMKTLPETDWFHMDD